MKQINKPHGHVYDHDGNAIPFRWFTASGLATRRDPDGCAVFVDRNLVAHRTGQPNQRYRW